MGSEAPGTWTRCWEIRRMPGNSSDVFTKQQRIAELAKRSPPMGFTSLAYRMDIDWLREALRRTRHDGAVGVDGQTADEYRANLERFARIASANGTGIVFLPMPVRLKHTLYPIWGQEYVTSTRPRAELHDVGRSHCP